jgi:hypothetical protein
LKRSGPTDAQAELERATGVVSQERIPSTSWPVRITGSSTAAIVSKPHDARRAVLDGMLRERLQGSDVAAIVMALGLTRRVIRDVATVNVLALDVLQLPA